MKLTKAQQRVAVAKDALAQLKAEKYKATSGVFIDSGFLNNLCYSDSTDQAQPVLQNMGTCRLCAKGAIFLSTIRKYNKATVYELTHAHEDVSNDLFGQDNLDRIEAAFECWSHVSWKACDFGDKYINDHDRLVAILKNIIKNNGTFKP